LGDDYEDNRWEYGYDEEDISGTRWDFSMGLEMLNRYGRELLKLVAADHYISGTVGLLIAVAGLKEWIEKYDDGYDDNELIDGCYDFKKYLKEALKRVCEQQRHDLSAQKFLRELIQWIVQQCKQLDDLPAWTSVLTDCVPTPQYLWYLKDQIMMLDKDFIYSARLKSERHQQNLVYWWVGLCLSLDQEEEAKKAACNTEGAFPFDDAVGYCFVRYYERRGNWNEAVKILQAVLNNGSRTDPQDYRWIIRLCEQSGDLPGVKDWYEKWFLSYPDFELFRRNMSFIAHDADRDAKIRKWIDVIKRKKEYLLLIGMHLYLNELDKAWAEFIVHRQQIYMDEPLLIRLFREMKSHEPLKLIPLYRDLALENISQRKRPAYARAAKWMKDMKEVCALSGKKEEWTAFLKHILTEYRRFWALIEEIRAAGIDGI